MRRLACVLALAVLTAGCASSGGSGDSAAAAPARLPGQKALQALRQYGVSVALGPLPGSVPSVTVRGAYTVHKPCGAVGAAYGAPGAPIPAGARVSAGPSGVLLVTDEYGDAEGVVMRAADGGSCQYALAPGPTVEVTGSGPVPAGFYWGTVGCATLYGKPSLGNVVAEFKAGGRPWVLAAGTQTMDATATPPPSAYRALLMNGTAATAMGGSPGTPAPVTMTDTGDGRVSAATSGEMFTVTCTTEYGKVLRMS